MKKINIVTIGKSFMIIMLISCFGCKKLIDIDPPIDKPVASVVFSDLGIAKSAITGIYASMTTNVLDMFTGYNSISVNGAVLADEMDIGPNAGQQGLLYKNLTVSYDQTEYWKSLYGNYLFRVNSIIQGVTSSSTIDEVSKSRILGEAKFIRAFCYFYLVNLYGDVPLALGTDFKVNSNLPRSPVKDVYKQMISDLKDAETLLSDNYLGNDLTSSTSERIRPNKFAAAALLARVYLYNKEWKNAEDESSKVISNSNYILLPNLNEVFLKNSQEAIWQLQPNYTNTSGQGMNTPDGVYLIPTLGMIPNFFASSWLRAAFEPNDQRQVSWLQDITIDASTYKIPYKYKIGLDNSPSTEYIMVLRLAEQYLIRAEARAQQTNLTGAASDLNAVRNRAGLSNTTASSPTTIANAILKERQTELFMEWGNRWLDLKRMGKIDDVMSVVTPTKVYFGSMGSWVPYKALFAIPNDQFILDPALRGHQNPGYTETP